MTCPVQEKLLYAFDESNLALREKIEAHVAGCENCRAELEQLRMTDEIFAKLPLTEAPEISAEAFVPAAVVPIRKTIRWARIAAAVALPLLMGIFILTNGADRRPINGGRIVPENTADRAIAPLIEVAADFGTEFIDTMFPPEQELAEQEYLFEYMVASGDYYGAEVESDFYLDDITDEDDFLDNL